MAWLLFLSGFNNLPFYHIIWQNFGLTNIKIRSDSNATIILCLIETGDRLGSSWFSMSPDKLKYSVSGSHLVLSPVSIVFQQNMRVTRQIVLPLLTKGLYEFGCFKEILQITKTCTAVFWMSCPDTILHECIVPWCWVWPCIVKRKQISLG